MERFKLSYTRTRRQKIIMSLAAIIVFVTTYALILPAITIDTDTAEIEPGMAVGTVETVDLPAASLQESVEGITVSVEAEAGVFPENTSMNLRVEDDKSLQPLLEAAVEGKVDRFEAVDISFADENGEPVSPQDTYSVKMISDSMEEKADRVLVKVSGEAATVVEDPEFTYKQVAFDATEDATYVIVEKSELTTDYLSADGNLYEVNVTYDYTAQIPDGARLTVSECDEDSSAYMSSRRAFLAVREGEEDAPEENELFMDIVDISIVAEDGSPVEPMAPVQVTVRRKNLPEDFESAGGSLLVQHLNNSGDKPFVETIDAAVLVSGDTLTANFTADSFSYYAFTWQPNNNQYRTVRIHYGYKNENNRFVEFDSSLLKQTPTISTSNEYAYLIYDVEGYKFDTAYYNNTNASSSPTNNNNRPTISGSDYIEIDPLIRYNDSRWRYWDGDSWEAMSYGNGTNRYSDIYVCYEPLEEPTLGGTAKPYEQFENPQRPSMSKTSENNHDGTRTITLSVDGDRTPVLHEKLADVIVVFDRSGSMKYNMSGSQTSNVATANQRITTAVRAVGDLADELLSQEYYNKDGRPQIRMSLVTFSNDAQAETLATDSPIMVDGEYWQNYPDYNFTTNATKYKDMLSGVTADGGTNWEQALQIANRMEVDPDRDTFVIFVTDGDPTFRMTRSPTTNNSDATIKGDTFTSGNTVYSYYRDYDVFGQGNNDSSGFNYAAALAEAQSIVAQHKKLYCIAIGAEGSVTKMQRLADEAGAEGVFEADDEDSLNAAFRDIKESIVAHYGWNNVDIVDGITTMTNLSAKANVVGADYDELTYTKIEHTPDGDVVTNNWDPTSERCELAGYNEATGALEWNMGPNFQLKKNCTYQVSFKVWPNQDAIDLVTKLNNHEITLDDLTPEQASQFDVVTQDGYEIYTLKTNTDVGMTYTLSKEDGDGVHPIGDPVYEPCNDEVEPLVMQTMPISIQKQFDDSLAEVDGSGVGEDRPTEVKLLVFRRLKDDPTAPLEPVNLFLPYGDDNNLIVLNEANEWKTEDFYVSPGLVDAGGVTREGGYDYYVSEPDIDYHYELDGELINPQMQGHSNNNEDLDYDASLVNTRQVYIVKALNGDLDESTDLTAINVVKGGMDIKKVVTDAYGNPIDSDAEFTIKGWILDKNGHPFTFDPALDDRTDKSKRGTDDTPLFNEHQNDPITYHFYDANGNRTIYKGHFEDTSDIEFTIKGGEELRFPLLPDGCTFSFWEVTEDMEGFVLTSAEGVAEEKKEVSEGVYDYVLSDDQNKYPVTGSDNHITGVTYGNTLDDLTFTNKKINPGSIIARKIVTKSDGVTQLFPDEDFVFQVRIRRSNNTTGLTNVPYVIRDKDGNVVRNGVFDNTTYSRNCEFTLKAGQSIEIPNVPDGSIYRVQENAVAGSGYTLVSVTGSAASSDGHTVTSPPVVDQSQLDRVNGTMHSDEEHSALFENRIDEDPTELQLVKKDKKDGSRINGVTFMLYTDANHTTEATDYQGNAINPLVTGGFADEEQTTPLGLAYIGNVWPGTYYLVETGPPNGYQPLSDHVTITVGNDGTVTVVNPDDASSTGAGAIPAVNGIVTIEIPNTKYSDMVLPSTGGIGTHLFYISGGLLLTAAAGIYIFSYRRRKGGKRRPDFPY